MNVSTVWLHGGVLQTVIVMTSIIAAAVSLPHSKLYTSLYSLLHLWPYIHWNLTMNVAPICKRIKNRSVRRRSLMEPFAAASERRNVLLQATVITSNYESLCW